MPAYRITIRYGAPKQQYHMNDIDAASLRDALRAAMEGWTADVDDTADLIEIRRLVEASERSRS